MVWMPKYTITKEILSYLTKIESIKNSFEDKPLSPVLLSSLHQSAKISQTHYSTQIEGNNLTLKQVENTLYTVNKSAQAYQGHDEKEVKAYYDAINYMEKHLEKNSPFSESFIQKSIVLLRGVKNNSLSGCAKCHIRQFGRIACLSATRNKRCTGYDERVSFVGKRKY